MFIKFLRTVGVKLGLNRAVNDGKNDKMGFKSVTPFTHSFPLSHPLTAGVCWGGIYLQIVYICLHFWEIGTIKKYADLAIIISCVYP